MGTRERTIAFETSVLDALDQRLSATGGDLSAFVNAAVAAELRRLPSVPPDLAGHPTLLDRSNAYKSALLDRDVYAAGVEIRRALDDGLDILDIYGDVVAPALREIGHLWSVDEIGVADEHYATTVTQQLVAELSPDRVPPSDGRLAVVTASPDELHTVGAQMVADVLRRDGWEVLPLGAATPAGALVELVENERPELVAISTTTAGRVPGLETAVRGLAEVRPRPLIVVGGGLHTAAAAEFVRGLGADVVTSDLRELRALLDDRFPSAA